MGIYQSSADELILKSSWRNITQDWKEYSTYHEFVGCFYGTEEKLSKITFHFIRQSSGISHLFRQKSRLWLRSSCACLTMEVRTFTFLWLVNNCPLGKWVTQIPCRQHTSIECCIYTYHEDNYRMWFTVDWVFFKITLKEGKCQNI